MESETTHDRVRKLSIIIPVYNEIRTLESLLRRVMNAPLPCDREIIVVDDGSTDGSREFLQSFAREHEGEGVRLVLHERNAGKGQAIRSALPHVTGDWVIVQDADLEYDPADYAVLLAPAMEGFADAVFGSRFIMGRYRRALYFWHTVLNKVLSLFCNMLSGLNLTDIETCYKLVRADILKNTNLRGNRFDIEPELTMKLAQWGARIYEVPISYRGRTYAEGKKIGAWDGLIALWTAVKYGVWRADYSTHRGFVVLQAMGKARRFNRWLLSQFASWLGDNVLEAGCGIGNLTTHLLDRKRLVCIDVEPFYVDRLQDAYGHLANVTFKRADLTRAEDMEAVAALGPFDTVLTINVLEHIEDDQGVLERFFRLLSPGGAAIVLVPNAPELYTPLDRALGHLRRYTADELTEKMTQAGFHVVACWGFNRVGALGWRLSGHVLGRETVSTGQIRLFEWGMPLIRFAERFPFHIHNSLIAIGRKPN
jgi:glycosyltransferase involved in cell wall biosynthesis